MTAVVWWILGVSILVCLSTVSVCGKSTETHINNGTFKLDSVDSSKSGKTKDGKVWKSNEVSGTWQKKGKDGGTSYGVFRNSEVTGKAKDGKPMMNKDRWTLGIKPKDNVKEKSGVTKDGKHWKTKTSGNSYTSPDGTVKYGWNSNSKTITDGEKENKGWFWNKKKGKPAQVAPPSHGWNSGRGSGWGSGWLFGGNRHGTPYNNYGSNYGNNPFRFGKRDLAYDNNDQEIDTVMHWRDDSRCKARKGECQHVDKLCAGTIITDLGLCAGGHFRKCCVN